MRWDPSVLVPLALSVGVVGLVLSQRRSYSPATGTGQYLQAADKLLAAKRHFAGSSIQAAAAPGRSFVLYRATCNSNECPVYASADQGALRFNLLRRGDPVSVLEASELWARVSRDGRKALGWVPRAFLTEETTMTPIRSSGSSPFG